MRETRGEKKEGEREREGGRKDEEARGTSVSPSFL